MEELLAQYNFTPDEIRDFLSNALVIQCPKKTVLLREGEIPRFFYWATKGIFRAGFTDKNGNEFTRAFFTPDTLPFVAAYGSFVVQRPSVSFLDTIEDGEVLSWRFDYIKKLEETEHKWLWFFKKQVDIVFSMREIKEKQAYTLTPEEKYIAFLETSGSIANRIPQHYIASYIGVSPEALSRIKKRLQIEKVKNNEK